MIGRDGNRGSVISVLIGRHDDDDDDDVYLNSIDILSRNYPN